MLEKLYEDALDFATEVMMACRCPINQEKPQSMRKVTQEASDTAMTLKAAWKETDGEKQQVCLQKACNACRDTLQMLPELEKFASITPQCVAQLQEKGKRLLEKLIPLVAEAHPGS